MPYFERTGAAAYAPTVHVGGAWSDHEQHVAPLMGVLAHEVEQHRERHAPDLVVTRLSYDILGLMTMEEVATSLRVVRPGRTVELVEVTATQHGRATLVLRAWLGARADTGTVSGTAFDPIGTPDSMAPWDPTTVWRGGFIASADVRREQREPGRAAFWVRTAVPLLDEPVGRLAAVCGLLDISNGMTVRADPTAVAFPNLDLTAHLFREPRGEPTGGWLGFDTTVSLGPGGVGLTSSVLHDADGAFGTSAQVLTVRPR